jgi:hypothetical protein
MRRLLTRRWLWLSLALTYAGCSTATLHPELVAKAAKVRVVREPSAVQGCQFLSSVSATEEPGFMSKSGVLLDPGTPAITLLQIHAFTYGGDTVEVTSSEQSLRAGAGRASTLTTLTGNAYRCVPPPQSTTASQPEVQVPGSVALTGEWKPFAGADKMDDLEFAGIILASANNPSAKLSVSCDQTPAGKAMVGGMWTSRPVVRLRDRSQVDIRFDQEQVVQVEMRANSVGKFIQLFEPDLPSFLSKLDVHSRLLVRVTFEAGDNEVLEFAIPGFSEAIKPALQACDWVR